MHRGLIWDRKRSDSRHSYTVMVYRVDKEDALGRIFRDVPECRRAIRERLD
jgi:hypothetical protein